MATLAMGRKICSLSLVNNKVYKPDGYWLYDG